MGGIQQEIAVITGAGRGLGLAMARRFAQSERHVVIAERDAALGAAAAEALRSEGLAASFEALDVRDAAQSRALVDAVAQSLGPISVWVNNAGISRLGAAETLSQEDWDDSIAVMLSGTFYCAQAVGRHMLANGRGVIALTEALGVEWARRGVRVVGIAPGVVATEMVRRTAADGHGDRAMWERRTPLRRLGEPEEIAEAALFLSSAEASYIVGETLRVDGGWVSYQLF